MRDNLRNIVEVGTWNGQGSTVCVMNAIIEKPNSKLYSVEADPVQYIKATEFWSNKTTSDKLVLLNGVLHNQYATEADIKSLCNGQIPYINEHYNPEKVMLVANNIINKQIFENIDILILDGGEYTTEGDFNVLIKLAPKIIMLDDVSVYKCKNIRNNLLNSVEWSLHKEDLTDRHGWSIFINKAYTI